LNYKNKNVAFLTIEVRDIKIKRHTTKRDNKKGQKFDFCRKPLWFVRRKKIELRGWVTFPTLGFGLKPVKPRLKQLNCLQLKGIRCFHLQSVNSKFFPNHPNFQFFVNSKSYLRTNHHLVHKIPNVLRSSVFSK